MEGEILEEGLTMTSAGPESRTTSSTGKTSSTSPGSSGVTSQAQPDAGNSASAAATTSTKAASTKTPTTQGQSSGQSQEPTCPSGRTGGCEGCPNRGMCSSARGGSANPQASQDMAIIRERLSVIKNIVIILSGKGGVGKSTFCSQLAFYLSEVKRLRVGILDIDICGPSIPTLTGTQSEEVHQCGLGWEPVTVSENLSVLSIGYLLPNKDDPVIWRGPRKIGLIQQFLSEGVWGDLDYLIIDTPPGTSDEHISILSMLSDAMPVRRASAIVVSTPQEVALADVRKEINFCRAVDLPIIGVVENMSGFVCPCCQKETLIFHPSTGGVNKMCETMTPPVRYLGRIPLDQYLGEAGEKGMFWQALIDAHAGEFASPGFAMFAAIVDQITHILG